MRQSKIILEIPDDHIEDGASLKKWDKLVKEILSGNSKDVKSKQKKTPKKKMVTLRPRDGK